MNYIPGVSESFSELETKLVRGVQQKLTTHSSHADIQKVQQALHETEQRLIRTGRLLKQQSNMCTPLGRLTDELILEILLYLEIEHHTYTIPRRRYFDFPGAHFLCTRWRNVAIYSPAVWSRITLPMPSKLLHLFLERSKMARLSVSLSTENIEEEEEHGEVLNQLGCSFRQLIPRISHLEILWSSDAEMQQRLDEFLAEYVGTTEFSALRSLNIFVQFFSLLRRGGTYALSCPLLKDLVIEGPFDSLPSSSFEHLSRFRWDTRGNILSFTRLFEMLSHFPALEECEVDAHPLSAHVHWDAPNLVLPKLRRLSLNPLHLSQLHDILLRLALPPAASISAKIYKGEAGEDTLERFFGFYMPMAEEFMVCSRSNRLVLTVTLTTGRRIEVTNMNAMVLPLGSYYPACSAHPIPNFPELAAYTSHLSRLVLCTEPLPALNDLVQSLSTWPHITYIRVKTDEVSFERLLSALENYPDIMCPLLRVLDCSDQEVSSNRIARFLAFRRANKVPVAEFRISSGFAVVGNS
ncbi:hypothetical protein SISSUDRAFT_1133496 [Sistotremastrum suecicum HHB10207 ss-3]|uniref:F-box domain-containing protein n=1 Tax=Sistotremastrum suecicum HHB10207 ss-3 TaxID=1314776 RepID=A0A165X3M9_9AGAM|nr:hypothetical protein SISSUDRAFT_1133496 [Sistotremastrum suecicum HHB10207 ss-3]